MALPRTLLLIQTLLGLSILGFADAAYLTILHYQNIIPPCSITSGCEIVLTSPYSLILGVPVALLGSLYYAAMIIGTALFLDAKNMRILKLLCLASSAGMLAALYFVSLELFVIHAICMYCTASALFSTLMFGIGIYLLRYSNFKMEATLTH